MRAVEEMVELIHSDGHEMPHPLGEKEFSGKFVLRVDPAIHRRLWPRLSPPVKP